jgi:DNA-binding FadR family transcriptional regulator
MTDSLHLTDHPPTATPRPPGPSIRERVLETIGKRILSGHYPEETALPTEAKLAAEFGVSRTALREAIKMLAAKGLLVSRQRAGTIVQQVSHWNRLDTDVLEWMAAFDPDPDFIRGLIEARRAIEPAAARFASMRASSRDLAEIEIAYEAMCAAAQTNSISAFNEADVAFHSSVLRASRNPVFVALVGIISQALGQSMRLSTASSPALGGTLDAHWGVFEAIRLRQPDLACDRMEALIDRAIADLSLTGI